MRAEQPRTPPESHQGSYDTVARARRTHDLDDWHARLVKAGDLALHRNDGRALVSSTVVKLVGFAIRAYMDGPGKPHPGANAYPGVDELSSHLGLSRAQVQAALRALLHHGYLVKTHAGGSGKAAKYAAALPVDNRLRVCRDRGSGSVGTEAQGLSGQTPPPQDLRRTSPPHPRGDQQPLPAAVSVAGGRGRSATPGPALQAVLAAIPPHHRDELLADRRVDDVDRRLTAVVDVVPIPEVVQVCTRRWPPGDHAVDSVAGLLLSKPRIQRLEQRAAARRRDQAQTATARRSGHGKANGDGDRWDDDVGRWLTDDEWQQRHGEATG